MQQIAAIQLISIGDVAELVYRRVLTKKMVYFVIDQYKPGSIKSLELEKRKASDSTMRVQIEKKEQKQPKQWKKYLRNDQNKSELVKFLLEDWSHPTRYADLFPPATILFFDCGSQFFRLSLKDGLTESVSELVCDQEDADKKCSCVPSTQNHLEPRLLVFQQWIPILQYTRCVLLCKYQFLCISRLVQVIDGDA